VKIAVSAESMLEIQELVVVEFVLVEFPPLVKKPVFSTQLEPSHLNVELVAVPEARLRSVDVPFIKQVVSVQVGSIAPGSRV
jgi:hypothetical protein